MTIFEESNEINSSNIRRKIILSPKLYPQSNCKLDVKYIFTHAKSHKFISHALFSKTAEGWGSTEINEKKKSRKEKTQDIGRRESNKDTQREIRGYQV